VSASATPPRSDRAATRAYAHTRGAELAIGLTLTPEQLDTIAARVAEITAARSPSDDGWLRGAEKIAAYIDCPPSRVYALSSAKRIPVEHDGSTLIARKSELDGWIRNGGGKRP
jgi:hypothetical protein